MCFLCAISQWSRRIAGMLPWFVIPFIFMWALSQLFPPGYRIEVTSSRLACLAVLLMSLVWYELLMPWLSQWRAHRSALLRERKLIEALEAAKWRKEATRRCRNCLTAYRIQMPGSGKYVCTYCGHISKRPVLEVAGALANPKLAAQVPSLCGSGAGMLHLKGACQGNRPLAAWSRAAEGNRCAWYGEGSSHMAEKCSLGQFLPAPFFFLSRIMSFVWQRLLGLGQSNTDRSKDLNGMAENADDFNRIKSDKARRKAERKKQARLQKEILEAEDRKQREEVALLVEERRRQRDELEVTKHKEREADAERDKEARRKWDNERLKEKAGKRIMQKVTDGPTDLGQEHEGAMQKSTGEVFIMASPMSNIKEQAGHSITTTTNTNITTSTTSSSATTTITAAAAATTASTFTTAKVSRGIVQDHTSRYRSALSSFPRLALLKGTGSRPQKAPGSVPKTGVISHSDGSYRGKKDAAHAVGKSTISTGSSNSRPKAAGTPRVTDSAWKRAPWISAWVKGSRGVTGDENNIQGETITDSGKKLDPNFSSGLKSSNNHAFMSKASSSPARGTAIQPPIAPPSVHVDPLQQLFSTPSLFSPMNLQANSNNQFERKLQSEMKAVFLPEHTFFEAQSYSQPSDTFAPPSTPPPIQMPMPVPDTIPISSQPTLGGTESSFIQSNVAVPQSSVPLQSLYDGVPTLTLEPTNKTTPFGPSDINAKDLLIPSSFLGSLKVSELDKEDFLPWDSADEAALQLPPLSTVQSLFESETLIPDGCSLSPQKMGNPKANEDVKVSGLQDVGGNSFSLGFNTAARIWDIADGSQKVPAEFVDCITQEIMEDPVITADGHSYERLAIEKWLKHHDTSPKTGEVLPPPPGSNGVDKTLRPNHILRGQIIEYKERLARMSELRSMTWSTSTKDAGSFFKVTSSPSVLSF